MKGVWLFYFVILALWFYYLYIQIDGTRGLEKGVKSSTQTVKKISSKYNPDQNVKIKS